MDAQSLILGVLDPIAGRHVLDVGCGAGALARVMVERGAVITGIEPEAQAIALARRNVPGATFLEASALAIPMPAASADGAVFLNSLHHVPDPRAALGEAARVVRPRSPIIVIEPLARGSFFDVLRFVEDETVVREAAQAAIAAAIGEGAFACERDEVFERVERFDAIERFLARVVAVGPARRAAVEARRGEIEASFARHAERDHGRYALRQPLRAHVLVRRD